MEQQHPDGGNQREVRPEDTVIGSRVRQWLSEQFAEIDEKFRPVAPTADLGR